MSESQFARSASTQLRAETELPMSDSVSRAAPIESAVGCRCGWGVRRECRVERANQHPSVIDPWIQASEAVKAIKARSLISYV